MSCSCSDNDLYASTHLTCKVQSGDTVTFPSCTRGYVISTTTGTYNVFTGPSFTCNDGVLSANSLTDFFIQTEVVTGDVQSIQCINAYFVLNDDLPGPPFPFVE